MEIRTRGSVRVRFLEVAAGVAGREKGLRGCDISMGADGAVSVLKYESAVVLRVLITVLLGIKGG